MSEVLSGYSAVLPTENRAKNDFQKIQKPVTIAITGFIGGEGGIRTHVPLRTTAFRVRLVMTTSILLLVDFSPTVPASAFSGLSFSGNFWAELFGRTQIFKFFCFTITVEITGFLSDITTSH